MSVSPVRLVYLLFKQQKERDREEESETVELFSAVVLVKRQTVWMQREFNVLILVHV